MRIPTRVALGSSLLILLLASVTAYEARMIDRLADRQRVLGGQTLPAATAALDLATVRDRIEEYLLKFTATGDPAYAAELVRSAEVFELELRHLRDLGGGGDLAELEAAWGSFRSVAFAGADPVAARTAEERERLREAYRASLERVRRLLLDIVESARRTATEQVEAAADAAARARRLAIVALVVSVALAAVITAITVQSIRRPLRRLIGATEAIADGRFDHRVEAGGSDEISRLGRSFNWMAERLADLDRLKRDFLSQVSHEIKTPLAAMAETSRLLLDEVAGPLTDRQRRLLELQRSNEERLQKMIVDILDLSRLEAGVMDYHFSPHRIGPVLEEVCGQFEALARGGGLAIEVRAESHDLEVVCDRDRLLQVLHNLVSNAVRVSPRSATVTVAAESWHTSGEPWVRVRVRDQGPGVPDDDKPLVFERFRRLGGPPVRDRAGVGLGLSICREIVEAHGGRIRVEDAPEGGADFVVELASAGPSRGYGPSPDHGDSPTR